MQVAFNLIFCNFSGENFVRGVDGTGILEEFLEQKASALVFLLTRQLIWYRLSIVACYKRTKTSFRTDYIASITFVNQSGTWKETSSHNILNYLE